MAKATKGKAFIKVKKKNNGANNQPTKLNEQTIIDICKYLQRGAYIETAVVLSNVGKTTFYTWMKESHTKKRTKHAQLCRELRNAVGRATEEATMRDIANIDKCAMGSKPVFDRHPAGTIQPARDDKGKVQTNPLTGEPLMIDVSGQIVCDYKGKPIIAIEGVTPSYQCSMWRLEKRKPKDWGNTINFVNDREPIGDHEDEQDNKNRMLIQFVPSENKK